MIPEGTRNWSEHRAVLPSGTFLIIIMLIKPKGISESARFLHHDRQYVFVLCHGESGFWRSLYEFVLILFIYAEHISFKFERRPDSKRRKQCIS